ncbi:MAG: universal stress protein [Proteobacteria bacterium]|nr:universal stress protein [Pseudomonadota bacterium]
MFRNILLPIDLTERSERAVKAAGDLAEAHAASVRLLHVVQTIADVPYDEMKDFYAELMAKAEDAVARWAENLSARGIEVEGQVVLGKRVPEILRHAEEGESDLIVMSFDQLDPAQPGGGLGSVGHQVALIAGCPVLLMR